MTRAPASPPALRRPLALTAGFAAVVVVLLSVLYAAGGTLGGFDDVEPPGEGIGPPLRPVALVIDFGGEPLGAALLTAGLIAVCLLLRRVRLAVLVVVGCGATVVLTTLLKPVVGRTIHGEFLSFPSGHTALATALALVIGLLLADLRRLGAGTGMVVLLTVAVVAGAAMAWAQVALGAHHTTDTVGGFCTALVVVPLSAWLVDTVADRIVIAA